MVQNLLSGRCSGHCPQQFGTRYIKHTSSFGAGYEVITAVTTNNATVWDVYYSVVRLKFSDV
jgi:hypothetical protein